MKLATRIFKRDDWYITSPFGKRTHPVTKQKNVMHYGDDLGTNCKNWPQYALEDGIVVSVRTGKKDKDGSGYGNYVKIKYERIGIRVFHGHLDKVYVKLNQKVTHDTCIGLTGKTGTATGIHLHLGLQTISSSTWLDPDKYDYIPPTEIIKPVERNEDVDQLKILKSTLRVRKEPNLKGEILGFAPKDAIYDDLSVSEEDGYKWHKIAENNYIAEVKDYIELLPKKEESVIEPTPEPITDNPPKEEPVPNTPVDGATKENIIIRIIKFILSLFKNQD